MKLNKTKLIISVIMIVLLGIGLSTSVFAADYNLTLNPTNTNNNVGGDMIEIVEGNTNTDSNTITINSNVSNKNEVTNTPGELANTGLEELPWLLIGVCVVSAIFAYKKIKEYRAY